MDAVSPRPRTLAFWKADAVFVVKAPDLKRIDAPKRSRFSEEQGVALRLAAGSTIPRRTGTTESGPE